MDQQPEIDQKAETDQKTESDDFSSLCDRIVDAKSLDGIATPSELVGRYRSAPRSTDRLQSLSKALDACCIMNKGWYPIPAPLSTPVFDGILWAIFVACLSDSPHVSLLVCGLWSMLVEECLLHGDDATAVAAALQGMGALLRSQSK